MSYLEQYLPRDWGRYINMSDNDFLRMGKMVASEREKATVYPESANVFKAFELTSYQETRVIVLSQDPYHGKGQAYGVAFGTLAETPPPSLVNIYKEIERSIYDGMLLDFDYTLKHWTSQGVLLLNTSLSVIEGVPGSHMGIWKPFTEAVIEALNQKTQLIWILLGNHAKKYIPLMSEFHVKLQAGHPSPLNTSVPFLGSDIFKKANDWLDIWELPTIKW